MSQARKLVWKTRSTLRPVGRGARYMAFGSKLRSHRYQSRYQGRALYARPRVSSGELKFHDLDIDDASIAANGNIAEDSCLTIPEGVGEEQRVGRKIVVKKIGWRFTVELLATATIGVSETVRVILYWDKQANGATAAVSGNAGILASDDYQSFLKIVNTGRFTTLMDRTYDVNVLAAAGDGTANDHPSTVINDSFYKTCTIPVEYDNSVATGEIASMRSNNIGVLLLSDTGARARFESKMRIRFSD